MLLCTTMSGVAQQIVAALLSAPTVVQCPQWHSERWIVPRNLVAAQPNDSSPQPASHSEGWLPLLTRTLQNEDGHFLRYCVDVLVAAYRAQQAAQSCEFYAELKKQCRNRHQLDQTRLGITALATMTQDSDRRAVLSMYLTCSPLPFQWQWITYHAIPRRLFDSANSSHLSSFISSCLGLNTMRSYQGLALEDVRTLASEWFGNKRRALHLPALPMPAVATLITPPLLAVNSHLHLTSTQCPNPLLLLSGSCPPTPVEAASRDIPFITSTTSNGSDSFVVHDWKTGAEDERGDTIGKSKEAGDGEERRAASLSECVRGFEVCDTRGAKESDNTSMCRKYGSGDDNLVREQVVRVDQIESVVGRNTAEVLRETAYSKTQSVRSPEGDPANWSSWLQQCSRRSCMFLFQMVNSMTCSTALSSNVAQMKRR